MANEYSPRPLIVDHVQLDAELVALVERLAEHAHDLWALQRMAEGWTHGAERNDAGRLHPCLVPYAALPESEKDYDRNVVLGTIRAIVALGFVVSRTPPRQA
jgi:hypothetical protein